MYLLVLSSQQIEIIRIMIPSLISVIGFAVTILSTKYSIKSESQKKYSINFINALLSIEYDLKEILQLYIIEKKNMSFEEINNNFYFIFADHRSDEGSLRNRNIAEKNYRISGHISNYGSNNAVKLYNLLLPKFCNPDESLYDFLATMGLLWAQLKYDALAQRIDCVDWISMCWPALDNKKEIRSICKSISKQLSKEISFKERYNFIGLKKFF